MVVNRFENFDILVRWKKNGILGFVIVCEFVTIKVVRQTKWYNASERTTSYVQDGMSRFALDKEFALIVIIIGCNWSHSKRRCRYHLTFQDVRSRSIGIHSSGKTYHSLFGRPTLANYICSFLSGSAQPSLRGVPSQRGLRLHNRGNPGTETPRIILLSFFAFSASLADNQDCALLETLFKQIFPAYFCTCVLPTSVRTSIDSAYL